MFVSKEGLLREGPQCVGCKKPSWMSINRRAVLGCCLSEDIFKDLVQMVRIED